MSEKKSIESLLEELRAIDDRELRFDLLIEFADRFVEVPSTIATRPFAEENKAPACESEAYVWALKNTDSTVKLYFAVENPQGISAKALAVILDETLSGRTAEEVKKINESIVYDIFGKSISMGKGQGLMGMIRLAKFLVSKL